MYVGIHALMVASGSKFNSNESSCLTNRAQIFIDMTGPVDLRHVATISFVDFLQAAGSLKNQIVKATLMVEIKGCTDPINFTGFLGRTLMCFKLYKVTGNSDDLNLCSEIVDTCTFLTCNSNRPVTFSCGNAGVYTLGATVANYRDDKTRLDFFLNLLMKTENGLVEAVAVLVSTMPRMRPDLPAGNLGQCYKNKSDFIKAWEKWNGHIAKLDCSAFWIQCIHHQTREGLRNLLQIMLGNLKNIIAATCHWMELCISQLIYTRAYTVFGKVTQFGSEVYAVETKHQLQWSNGNSPWYSGRKHRGCLYISCWSHFHPFVPLHICSFHSLHLLSNCK